MIITFISNYLTHHQKPFCDRMASLLGDGFTFVATVPVEQERLSMGWKQETGAYLLRAYESDEQQKKAQRLIDDADIAIIGSAPDHLIVPRLKAKKITFKYAERFYKQGLNWKTFPRAVVGSWLHHGRFQKYPIYLLCASAYTAADAAVASHAIGAVPFLIQDGANGLIYQNGNQAQLEQQVLQLLEDAPYRRRLGGRGLPDDAGGMEPGGCRGPAAAAGAGAA